MKVLHVAASMAPEWGGPVAVVRGLTAALGQRGVRCEIATTRGYRVGVDAPPLPGVPIHRFATGFPGRWWTAYARRLARFLDTEIRRFALVHVHELWHFGGYAAYRAARRHGVPYLVTIHGELDEWRMAHKGIKKAIYRRLIQDRMLNAAAALHAIADAEAARIAALGFRAPVFLAPNGIDPAQLVADPPDVSPFLARYPQLAGKRVILFLGRLHAVKGLDVLARGFVEIVRRRADVALLVVGPDEDGARHRMERMLAAAGAAERTVFTGLLTGDDKLAAFACADLFALPSYSEGFSMTILEAMAAGLPVVISEPCNFPEVAENEAGFVVPAQETPAARAIDALLADESLRLRMGRNGRRLVTERYTWPAVAEAMAGLYRRIAGQAAEGSARRKSDAGLKGETA